MQKKSLSSGERQFHQGFFSSGRTLYRVHYVEHFDTL